MKVDFNAVIAGDYDVRVGNEYEIAPGKWGTMRPPTGKLQEDVIEASNKMGEGEGDYTDLDLCYKVLDGLPKGITQDDVIAGMPAQAVIDFFSLLTRIAQKLGGGTSQLEVSVPTESPKSE